MASLKVIALISGGKDSLFSTLHCLANGHEIIALGNLYPPSSADQEDIDSYMYQTVGHSIIPLYEQALQIPLYRQEITGNAVNSKRDYSVPQASEAPDETESLLPLLNRIIAAHPEANAVSTGAILSTYQRTRVESVALRLGLTPLSYLWQYPLLPPYRQSNLLHDMAAIGQEAIIIKTASGGLDETFLGLNVTDHKTIARLSKAMGRFGEDSIGAILGEGGEFETLALDGPALLWKKRIELEPAAAVVQDSGTSIYKTHSSRLVEKRADEKEITMKDLRVPDMLDDEFKSLIDRLGAGDTAGLAPEPIAQDGTTTPDGTLQNAWGSLPLKSYNDTPTVFTCSNLTGYEKERTSSSPQRQLTVILLQLDYLLKQWKLSNSSVNHCTLLLRDMADFTLLNPIYGEYFHYTNPPARVTVAVGDAMPQPYDVMLSVVIDKRPVDKDIQSIRTVDRQGLHVQSRSYWAPANIGPYSQAISSKLPEESSKDEEGMSGTGEVVYVAGQIPLIPASMEVYQTDGFKGQAVLSLQHLWRIGRAKGVQWWSSGVAMIADIQRPNECVKTAQAAWKAIHSQVDNDEEEDDENEEIDPWDRLNQGPSFNDNTIRAPIPNRSSIRSSTGTTKPIPPCFVAQVSSLPRSVNIEWCATGLTSPSITHDSALSNRPITLTTPHGTLTRFFTVEITSVADIIALTQMGETSVSAWSHATLYAGPEMGRLWEEVRMRIANGVQWVPCFKVWGEEAREIKGVLVGRGDRVEG